MGCQASEMEERCFDGSPSLVFTHALTIVGEPSKGGCPISTFEGDELLDGLSTVDDAVRVVAADEVALGSLERLDDSLQLSRRVDERKRYLQQQDVHRLGRP